VDGIKSIANQAGVKVVGFLATHYHWDHVGGTLPAKYQRGGMWWVPGVDEWVESSGSCIGDDGNSPIGNDFRIVIHETELEQLLEQTKICPEVVREVGDVGDDASTTGSLAPTPAAFP
jgi:hypothetical protein